MTEIETEATHTVDYRDVVYSLEFAPFEWGSPLLAIGGETTVTVASCKFKEESTDVDDVEYSELREFQIGSRIMCLSWSPESSLIVVPKIIKFVAASADHKLRLISSELKTDDTVKILEGHTSYINSVRFDTESGDFLASVSDDHTCRIWSKDGLEKVCLPLGAPGMSVYWHREELAKILVAQKNGIIRIYSLHNNQPIMSLDCGHAPLMSCDWCPQNSLLVGAVAGTEWLIFNTSESSQPIERHPGHTEGCNKLLWAHSHENLIATSGKPGSQVKIFNTRHNQVILNKTFLISNSMSWHYRLPILAVGGDRKLFFWLVEST